MEKDVKQTPEQNNTTLFKGVAISLFWMLITLISAFIIFEFALKLMSAPSTVAFISGIVLIAFCILATVCILYIELKKIFKKPNNTEAKPENKQSENK